MDTIIPRPAAAVYRNAKKTAGAFCSRGFSRVFGGSAPRLVEHEAAVVDHGLLIQGDVLAAVRKAREVGEHCIRATENLEPVPQGDPYY